MLWECKAIFHGSFQTASWFDQSTAHVTLEMICAGHVLQTYLSLQDSDVYYIPTSGLSGENLTTRSKVAELTAWYTGPCLLEQIGVWTRSIFKQRHAHIICIEYNILEYNSSFDILILPPFCGKKKKSFVQHEWVDNDQMVYRRCKLTKWFLHQCFSPSVIIQMNDQSYFFFFFWTFKNLWRRV